MHANEVMKGWREFSQPEALAAASRYELEKLERALWQDILQNEDVAAEVIAAHRTLSGELRLRKHH